MKHNNLSHIQPEILPTSKEEMERLGWDQADIILVSGDAYVDHPSFGIAVLGRLAAARGLRVAILPQPNWRDDLRDFKKLGAPRLFFGVSAGAMDSMINHYTALRRKRSDDAYTPGGRAGYRPDYPSVVYSQILKSLFPDTPLLLGGIEASMRRFSHYDYWQDKVKPSVLVESGADLLIYGMGEQPFLQILDLLERGVPFPTLLNIPQTAFLCSREQGKPQAGTILDTLLPSHEDCVADKKMFAKAFCMMEEASNMPECNRLVQGHGDCWLVVNPPFAPAKGALADLPYDLPYSRRPHPRYLNKPPIPAYEMIKFSVNIHRGCFGGCSFCAIAAHQGKSIVSRSEDSILKELGEVARLPGFKGHISDLGGPSANMYGMEGISLNICRKCKRPSCIFPAICKNLNYDHHPLIRLYDKALRVDGIRKITIGSGVRYDMFINQAADISRKYGLHEYARKLLLRHVSGRLKVAPEHTAEHVLKLMRKPAFKGFVDFHKKFREICQNEDLPWQLIPYFISGHPGCQEGDMQELAMQNRKMGIKPEQVQEFTPTPMTLSTTMYYTGINPYTGEKLFSARSDVQKRNQKNYFFKPLPGKKLIKSSYPAKSAVESKAHKNAKKK